MSILMWWSLSVAPRFSQCELCFHFKSDLANAASMEERLGILMRYRKHLADQYQDRSICWGLQELCLDEMSNLLVLQTDGMDQAKFRLPRDPKLRASAAVCLAWTCWFLCNRVTCGGNLKHWTGFKCLRPTEKRPKVKVHGVWCFGILVCE